MEMWYTREAASSGNALELHNDLRDQAVLECMAHESIHGHLGLHLDGFGCDINGEHSSHVARVNDSILLEVDGACAAGGAMVYTEVTFGSVEVPDLILNPFDGLIVLFPQKFDVLLHDRMQCAAFEE